jgi:hypothetical protein
VVHVRGRPRGRVEGSTTLSGYAVAAVRRDNVGKIFLGKGRMRAVVFAGPHNTNNCTYI